MKNNIMRLVALIGLGIGILGVAYAVGHRYHYRLEGRPHYSSRVRVGVGIGLVTPVYDPVYVAPCDPYYYPVYSPSIIIGIDGYYGGWRGYRGGGNGYHGHGGRRH